MITLQRNVKHYLVNTNHLAKRRFARTRREDVREKGLSCCVQRTFVVQEFVGGVQFYRTRDQRGIVRTEMSIITDLNILVSVFYENSSLARKYRPKRELSYFERYCIF